MVRRVAALPVATREGEVAAGEITGEGGRDGRMEVAETLGLGDFDVFGRRRK